MGFREESDKYVNNIECIQTIDVLKKKNILTVTRTWLNLADHVSSEVGQSQQRKTCNSICMRHSVVQYRETG